jgi:hypothetical protein
MPTKKPRITITLDEEAYSAVSAYSAVTGQPISKFYSELTAGVLPTIRAVTQAYEVSKNINAMAGAELNTAMAGVATGVGAAKVRAVSDLSLAVAYAAMSPDDDQKSGEKGEVSGVNPLATNRGVRSNSVRGQKRGGRTLWVASSKEEKP